MRIGLIGKMCSGKSTIANKLKNNYPQYKITSFAKKIKYLAEELFCMKEKDRKLLQDIGTKMREIDEDVWIKYLLNDIKDDINVIIDDVRYENEMKYLKNENFILIYLDISEELQERRIMQTYKNTFQQHIHNKNHESENLDFNESMIDYKFVINTKNQSEIYEKIDNIIFKENIEIDIVKSRKNCCIFGS